MVSFENPRTAMTQAKSCAPGCAFMVKGSRGETTYAGKDLIMEKEPSVEEVKQALSRVMHPAIDRSLMDLGMIKDIALLGKTVSLTLLTPFPGIPILSLLKEQLIESLRPLGIDLEINEGQMNQEEIKDFLAMEKEAWKGL
jgi:metal-sulfur cluster biosynthetic enzyme